MGATGQRSEEKAGSKKVWGAGPCICNQANPEAGPTATWDAQNTARDSECRAAGDWRGAPREPGYLDGGGAAFLILALAQQTVGLHVVAGHRHGLHHVQAVAAAETDRAVGAGPQEVGSLGGEGLGKGEGVPREYGVYKGSGWRQPPSPTQSLTAPGHWPSEPALQSVPTGLARKTLTFPKLLPLAALVSPAMVLLLGLIHSKDFQPRAGDA